MLKLRRLLSLRDAPRVVRCLRNSCSIRTPAVHPRICSAFHTNYPLQRNQKHSGDVVEEAEFVEMDPTPPPPKSEPTPASSPTFSTMPPIDEPGTKTLDEMMKEVLEKDGGKMMKEAAEAEGVFDRDRGDEKQSDKGMDAFDMIWDEDQVEKKKAAGQPPAEEGATPESTTNMAEELVQIYSLVVDSVYKAANIEDGEKRQKAKKAVVKDCRCYVIGYKEILAEVQSLSGEDSFKINKLMTSRLLPKANFIRRFRDLLKMELRSTETEPFDHPLFSEKFEKLMDEQKDHYLEPDDRTGGVSPQDLSNDKKDEEQVPLDQDYSYDKEFASDFEAADVENFESVSQGPAEQKDAPDDGDLEMGKFMHKIGGQKGLDDMLRGMPGAAEKMDLYDKALRPQGNTEGEVTPEEMHDYEKLQRQDGSQMSPEDQEYVRKLAEDVDKQQKKKNSKRLGGHRAKKKQDPTLDEMPMPELPDMEGMEGMPGMPAMPDEGGAPGAVDPEQLKQQLESVKQDPVAFGRLVELMGGMDRLSQMMQKGAKREEAERLSMCLSAITKNATNKDVAIAARARGDKLGSKFAAEAHDREVLEADKKSKMPKAKQFVSVDEDVGETTKEQRRREEEEEWEIYQAKQRQFNEDQAEVKLEEQEEMEYAQRRLDQAKTDPESVSRLEKLANLVGGDVDKMANEDRQKVFGARRDESDDEKEALSNLTQKMENAANKTPGWEDPEVDDDGMEFATDSDEDKDPDLMVSDTEGEDEYQKSEEFKSALGNVTPEAHSKARDVRLGVQGEDRGKDIVSPNEEMDSVFNTGAKFDGEKQQEGQVVEPSLRGSKTPAVDAASSWDPKSKDQTQKQAEEMMDKLLKSGMFDISGLMKEDDDGDSSDMSGEERNAFRKEQIEKQKVLSTARARAVSARRQALQSNAAAKQTDSGNSKQYNDAKEALDEMNSLGPSTTFMPDDGLSDESDSEQDNASSLPEAMRQ